MTEKNVVLEKYGSKVLINGVLSQYMTVVWRVFIDDKKMKMIL